MMIILCQTSEYTPVTLKALGVSPVELVAYQFAVNLKSVLEQFGKNMKFLRGFVTPEARDSTSINYERGEKVIDILKELIAGQELISKNSP